MSIKAQRLIFSPDWVVSIWNMTMPGCLQGNEVSSWKISAPNMVPIGAGVRFCRRASHFPHKIKRVQIVAVSTKASPEINTVPALQLHSIEDEEELLRHIRAGTGTGFEALFDVHCKVTHTHYCRGCVYEAEPFKTASWFHFLWPECWEAFLWDRA